VTESSCLQGKPCFGWQVMEDFQAAEASLTRSAPGSRGQPEVS
jgi:hypothetical protein